MFDNPRLIQAFAAGFAFFVSGLLSFFLFTAGRKDRSARAFAYALVAISTWGLFGFFFEITSPEKLDLARSIRIISVAFIAILTASINTFAEIFYREHIKIRKTSHMVALSVSYAISAVIVLLLMLDLFTSSGYIVKEVVLAPNGALDPIPGSLFHIIYIYFFVGTLLSGYLLWKSRNADSPLIKNQVAWMLGSIIVGLIAGGSRFGTWYGINGSPALASLAAPIFGIGFFYAIVKHHLFNIRVIGAEILTFSIWGFLFLLIVFSDTTSQRIVNSILFLCVVILGTFLVRGTLREVDQKEELKKANSALKNLNQNLEEIVRERTEELNRAKLHTDAIIENLVLGLVEYKNDFTIMRVNKAAENFLGFDRSRVMGKKITGENITDKELSSLTEVIHLDPSKGVAFEGSGTGESLSELTINHPINRSLQVFTFSIASEEMTGGKEDRQFIKIIRDVTREKLIDQNKSDFIKIAAHQLRTPLSAIKWVFNLALEAGNAPLSPDQVNALKEGYQSNERMINLINDLLNVVYIEDGRFGYAFERNDIFKTVSDVVSNTKTMAEWKKISLETHLPDHPIDPFLFDMSRLSLALTNIVENAINYTQEGGRVDVSAWQEGNEVKISVKDNGMGIPHDEMQKLFVTKFFRSVKALRAQTDGSGLGLYIAHNIVKSHHGKIILDSEENKGTTVTITLPTTLTIADEPEHSTHQAIEV